MNRDPIRRLGAGEADAEDIKKHPFFRDINFDDVYNKKIPPMYFPQIVSFAGPARLARGGNVAKHPKRFWHI